MFTSRLISVTTPSAAVSSHERRRSEGRGGGGARAGAGGPGASPARAGEPGPPDPRAPPCGKGRQGTCLPPGTRLLASGPCGQAEDDRRDRLPRGTGRLVLGGAPRGQPGDVGPRLRQAMAEADVLAVEDTRRLHRLGGGTGGTIH